MPESPADKAGVGPGMKLLAVNGRKFDDDLLKDCDRSNADIEKALNCYSKTPPTIGQPNSTMMADPLATFGARRRSARLNRKDYRTSRK